ncbi:hypothetical protein GGI25_000017 [Coemansia spiralis]|uniref:Male-enhanced antigen 1 n=2 Tax=Coemansia TaxID=4863 RepID=A0A9W8GD34_9FUNG|nr:hypothetical protein BX070DRAFT_232044 [Coemansia spiralis]KAJ1989877.1 hypothetical protein EDC05_004409 [Coemansia umbellata]KAJ2623107.1 hypothetical protein GGI26_002718 [Coemansia sp. RSA 1358]KAJ2681064.1 hypothetical protein GGI25_000017 [Coemansia spiralis]
MSSALNNGIDKNVQGTSTASPEKATEEAEKIEGEQSDDDDSIFVADNDYAPLDDDDNIIDEANKIHEQEPVDNDDSSFDIDLSRIIDERINAELAEKRPNTTLNDDSLHYSAPSNITPIEVTVDSSKQMAMSGEHVKQIKDIMAGIQLSDKAIPEWAKRVPERKWMPRRRQPESPPSPPLFTDLDDQASKRKDDTC